MREVITASTRIADTMAPQKLRYISVHGGLELQQETWVHSECLTRIGDSMDQLGQSAQCSIPWKSLNKNMWSHFGAEQTP
eukprot:15333758-Ditylum_brightwellii.AAC.1